MVDWVQETKATPVNVLLGLMSNNNSGNVLLKSIHFCPCLQLWPLTAERTLSDALCGKPPELFEAQCLFEPLGRFSAPSFDPVVSFVPNQRRRSGSCSWHLLQQLGDTQTFVSSFTEFVSVCSSTRGCSTRGGKNLFVWGLGSTPLIDCCV